LLNDANKDYDANDDKGCYGQLLGEFIHAQLQRRPFLLDLPDEYHKYEDQRHGLSGYLPHHLKDNTKLCAAPRCYDHTTSSAIPDQGPHKRDTVSVGQSNEAFAIRPTRLDALVASYRLSGQAAFVYFKVGGRYDTDVGRDAISSVKVDNVTWDEFIR
jgi:hypothetical protein